MSLALATSNTTVPSRVACSTSTSSGTVKSGGVVSTTVTVMDFDTALPESSVAVKVTVVTPSGQIAGALLVMVTEASQISVADAVKGTIVPASVACSTIILAGTVRTGTVVSRTRIDTVSGSLLRPSAATTRVTTVVPSGKVPVGVTPVADPPDHVQL